MVNIKISKTKIVKSKTQMLNISKRIFLKTTEKKFPEKNLKTI